MVKIQLQLFDKGLFSIQPFISVSVSDGSNVGMVTQGGCQQWILASLIF
jgi:hypothetical protein